MTATCTADTRPHPRDYRVTHSRPHLPTVQYTREVGHRVWALMVATGRWPYAEYVDDCEEDPHVRYEPLTQARLDEVYPADVFVSYRRELARIGGPPWEMVP